MILTILFCVYFFSHGDWTCIYFMARRCGKFQSKPTYMPRVTLQDVAQCRFTCMKVVGLENINRVVCSG